MAKTGIDPSKYSIYSQRSAEKEYVDWGKVAKDVTLGITTIAAERQKEKDALDTLTTEAINNLSQTPDVNSQSASSLIISASDMSKKNLEIQTDLLKRGLITPKDYQLFMNQQKTGYASLSTAIKNWDGWYTKSREWLEPGEGLDGNTIASEFMIEGMTSLQSFGNLNNKMLWTNPTNGQLQLVEMGKDKNGDYTIMPDASKNPEKFLNPGVIGARQNMEDRRKILAHEASYLVDDIAETVIAWDKNGLITSIEDFKRYGVDGKGSFGTEDGKEMTYKDWLEGQVGSLTATANESGQILMERPGYEIAESISDFCRKVVQKGGEACKAGATTDPRWIKIAYENDRMDILLTDDQKDRAKELASNAVELQIGKNIKKAGREIPDPKPTDKATQIRETKTDIINEYNTILTGDNETNVRDLLDGQIKLRNDKEADKTKHIIGYELTDDAIQFKYADGKMSEPIKRRTELKGDNPQTTDVVETDFVTYEGTGLTNQIYRLYNELGGHGGGAFNSAAQVQSAVKDYDINLGKIREGDTLAGQYRQTAYDMSDAKSQIQSANDFVKAMGGGEDPWGQFNNDNIDLIASNLDVEVEKAFPLELLNEMDKEGLAISSNFEAKDNEHDPSFIEYQILDKNTGEVIETYTVENIYGTRWKETKTYKEIYDSVHKGFIQPYLTKRNDIRVKANKKTTTGELGDYNEL